jgi:two-component system, NarL family, response regulator LiaR
VEPYHYALTRAELAVIKPLLSGLTDQQIANAMNLKLSTVKCRLRRIMDKLSVDNRVQVVVYAMAHQLVELPPLHTPPVWDD